MDINGIDIYCGQALPTLKLSSVLQRHFSDIDFSLLDIDAELTPEEANIPNKGVIMVEEIDGSVFPFCVSVFLAKEKRPQDHFLRVARDIALLTKADCVCGYVNLEDSENPYYSILFKADGSSYLADDSGWEETQSVEVLGPVDLKL